MARIAGIDLPREKRVEIGLTYIYGIGKPTAQKILADTGVNPDTRVKELSEEEVNKIRNYVEHNLRVEGDLHREVALNIKRLMAVIAAFVTARACPCADRTPSKTHAPAKDPSARLAGPRKSRRA